MRPSFYRGRHDAILTPGAARPRAGQAEVQEKAVYRRGLARPAIRRAGALRVGLGREAPPPELRSSRARARTSPPPAGPAGSSSRQDERVLEAEARRPTRASVIRTRPDARCGRAASPGSGCGSAHCRASTSGGRPQEAGQGPAIACAPRLRSLARERRPRVHHVGRRPRGSRSRSPALPGAPGRTHGRATKPSPPRRSRSRRPCSSASRRTASGSEVARERSDPGWPAPRA